MRYSILFASAIAVLTTSIVAAVPSTDGEIDGLVARRHYARALRNLESRGDDRALFLRDLLEVYSRDSNERIWKRAPRPPGVPPEPEKTLVNSPSGSRAGTESEPKAGPAPSGGDSRANTLSGTTVGSYGEHVADGLHTGSAGWTPGGPIHAEPAQMGGKEGMAGGQHPVTQPTRPQSAGANAPPAPAMAPTQQRPGTL
ncbi:hypothetical protein EIP91_009649 [Steccherinum ochraceum]|uniref:Uncharacterized protein n=1 Tax=Steccherinum ochraceum TaxID=92696 RepID=A0A4R0R3N0_9APHY|nr:hypothetical protein EIP91_009649 [Steccherinum ochraceum]